MPGKVQTLSTAMSALAFAVAIAPVTNAETQPSKEAAGRAEKPPAPKEGAGRERSPTTKEGAGRERPQTPKAPRGQTEGELSPDAELARAAAYYEAGQYAQCAEAFAGIGLM